VPCSSQTGAIHMTAGAVATAAAAVASLLRHRLDMVMQRHRLMNMACRAEKPQVGRSAVAGPLCKTVAGSSGIMAFLLTIIETSATNW
jgi:hypothetical protein